MKLPIPLKIAQFITRHNADEWRGHTGELCSHRNIPMENFYILATDGEVAAIEYAHSGSYALIKLANVEFPKRARNLASSGRADGTPRAPRKSKQTVALDNLSADLQALLDLI